MWSDNEPILDVDSPQIDPAQAPSDIVMFRL